MLSLSAQLSWATRVHPAKLRAHLEAHINIRPVIHTLRLCNQFGKGPGVGVNRLPYELIGMIEELMAREERAQRIEYWMRDYRCWVGICESMDHFDRDEQEVIFCSEVEELCSECDEYECHGVKHTLDTAELERLANYVDLRARWLEPHADRAISWQRRVGYATNPARGLFTKHESVIISDFGLSVWIAHAQRSHSDALQMNSVHAWTTAYFTLPDHGEVEWSFDRCFEDETSGGDSLMPTEYGRGTSIAMPTQPSTKSLKRFRRAFTKLGLVPTLTKKNKTSLYATTADLGQAGEGGQVDEDDGHGGKQDEVYDQVEDDEEDDEKDCPKGKMSFEKACLPELRLLVTSRDTAADFRR